MFRNNRKNNQQNTPNRDKPRFVAQRRVPAPDIFSVTTAPARQAAAEATSSEVDGDGFSWQALLLLLILCPYFVRAAQPPKLSTNLNERLLNGDVDLFKEGLSSCENKSIGDIRRYKCEIMNTSYYVKLWPVTNPMISHTEFNREFIKDNLGLGVPNANFFRIYENGVPKVIYATQEIKNVEFISLMENEIPKFAVKASFIGDMHFGNWAKKGKRLVVLDFDDGPYSKKNKAEYLLLAYGNYARKNVPNLSIQILTLMIEIYSEMYTKKLPKYHRELHLTPALYAELLDTHIDVCRTVIKKFSPENTYFNEFLPEINNAMEEEYHQRATTAANELASITPAKAKRL